MAQNNSYPEPHTTFSPKKFPQSWREGTGYLSRSLEQKSSLIYRGSYDSSTAVAGIGPASIEERSPARETTPLINGTSSQNGKNVVYEDIAGQAGFIQSLFNSCNILLGVGILALPFALSQSGWIGVLFLLFLAGVTNYTGKIIAWCMEKREGINTYPEIGEAAFGDWGRILISSVLYTELFCTLSLFFILEADNLQHLVYGGPKEDPHMQYHVRMFMFATAAVVLPTTWLRDLRWMSFVSVLGFVSAIVLLSVIIWDGLANGLISEPAETQVLSLETLPVCFGLMSFGYAGHAVFPSIYTSMKDREKKYGRMLDLSYLFVMLAYLAMSVLGYLMYGADTEQQITLNLPEGALTTTIATCLILVNPLTKFALTAHPIALAFEEVMFPKIQSRLAQRLFSLAVRTGLVVSSLFVAMLVPYFALVISFIGAFMTMAVSAIFPCLCYLRLYQGQLRWWTVLFNSIIIIIGLVCAASGTYSAVLDIAERIMGDSDGPVGPVR